MAIVVAALGGAVAVRIRGVEVDAHPAVEAQHVPTRPCAQTIPRGGGGARGLEWRHQQGGSLKSLVEPCELTAPTDGLAKHAVQRAQGILQRAN